MLKRILSTLGFGSAKVKLWLPSNTFRQGDLVKGMIYVDGGKTVQKVRQLYLHLEIFSQYEKGDNFTGINTVTDSLILKNNFYIDGEHFWEEVPFEYILPLNIPATYGCTRFELLAGLSIPDAINPYDRSRITILPAAPIQAFLEILSEIGLRHCSESGASDGNTQLFFFKPGNFGKGKFGRLKVVFKNYPDKLFIFLETERMALPTMEMPAEFFSSEITSGKRKAEDQIKEYLNRYL